MKKTKGSTHTGRFESTSPIPRSATFKVGDTPMGKHPTYSKTSKKKAR